MELFKIFGTVGLVGIDKFNSDIDAATGKGKTLAGTLGNILGTAAKVGGVAVAAAGTAVAFLTKSAVSAYADYEQLVGGVETLFGAGGKNLQEYADSVGKSVDQVATEYDRLIQSQTEVLNNSSQAYYTAGMSANDYMETVTSYSASLLQSVGGDTVKAASIADMAIRDMSDNANKMGTAMGRIQDAYQGFAKQNYTMLDNLKLGYGGTKTEMQRLLKDATALTGVKYDLKNLNDVFEAIHVIQEEIGITGTTEAEAAETIQGSLAMTKAAWENLLVGFADGEQNLNELVGRLVDSFIIAFSNITTRIITILPRLVTGLQSLMDQLLPFIPVIVESLLPGVIQGALALVTGLVALLPEIFAILIDALPGIIEMVKEELFKLLPGLREPFSVIEEIFSGVWDALQVVWEEIGQPIFEKVAQVFNDTKEALQPFIDTFTDYVLAGEFAKDATEAVTEAINFMKEAFAPTIEILRAAWEKLIEILQPIIDKITEWVTSGQAATAVTNLLQFAIQFLADVLQAVAIAILFVIELVAFLIDAFVQIIETVANLVASVPQMWEEIKARIAEKIASIVANVTSKFQEIKNTVETKIQEILNSIQSFFSDIITTVTDKAKEILKEVQQKWQDIKDVFKDALEVGKKVVDDIKQGISDAWNGLKTWFRNLWNSLFGNLTANINVRYSSSGNRTTTGVVGNGGRAKGLDYVPYDGFVAQLHKGEMIVPAAIARSLRVGFTGFGGDNTETKEILLQILDAVESNNRKESVVKLNSREIGRVVRGYA